MHASVHKIIIKRDFNTVAGNEIVCGQDPELKLFKKNCKATFKICEEQLCSIKSAIELQKIFKFYGISSHQIFI